MTQAIGWGLGSNASWSAWKPGVVSYSNSEPETMAPELGHKEGGLRPGALGAAHRNQIRPCAGGGGVRMGYVRSRGPKKSARAT